MNLTGPLKLNFKGNRFKIIIHNTGTVYYHKAHMLNFIENAAPSLNRLLLAVVEDLRNKIYLTATRALGLVGKLITGPYFRTVGKTERILDLSPHLHKLQLALQQLSQDASLLLQGQVIFYEEIAPIHQSRVYASLFESNDHEFDILTQQTAELICSSMLLVLENQCDDQLPGGKY